MNTVQDLLDDIRRLIRDANVDGDVKRSAIADLQELDPQIDRVTNDDRYRDFLLQELQASRERYQIYCAENTDERLEASPYDEVRTEPVCTCSGRYAPRCPLKRGELPREIRTADTLAEGIREFRMNHNGNPLVLTSAQQRWSEEVAEVQTELRKLVSRLSGSLRETPEEVTA